MAKGSAHFWKLIAIPTARDQRGSASFLQVGKEVPFKVKRAYYLYGVPKGKARGAHAHKWEKQIIVAVSGSFDVLLEKGKKTKRITLGNPARALYIAPMVWREFRNFSKDAVLLALVDDVLDQKEYIRDYAEFKRLAG
ncbi:MAG: WxcM-like domain-containing protein [Candidatus Micrarchaeota archaeon]|nr:WxcM-like domain-containing protein [Candidatus Micrarchaeota archaeon]